MISISLLLKKWQKALQVEIMHLKKFGSNKYRVSNGRLMIRDGLFLYFFDVHNPVRIPNGSNVRMQWGSLKVNGRLLSSEGSNIIIELEQNLGDMLSEAIILHDPWELLDELFERLEEIKENKQKRRRIKRLMDPSMPIKHPTDKITSNVHELILRSKYNPVTYVWGPPGTGKTYTLARVVANHYFKGKRVLVLAQSNQAVDVLMKEISSFVETKGRFREGDLIRYGAKVSDSSFQSLSTSGLIEKKHPDLASQKNELLEERKLIKLDLTKSFSKRDSEQLLEIEKKLSSVLDKIRLKEIELVKDAEIVGATLAKAATDPLLYEDEFDYIVLDEASMAFVPQVAFATSLGKRAIVCGDFKQLPPIASSRHQLVDEWLREDIYHRSGVIDHLGEKQLHPHLFLLKEQRRMHPDISAFTNKHIYHSLVGDHSSVKQSRESIVARSPFMDQAAILLDTSYTGEHCMSDKSTNSRVNLWQLLLSFQLIHEAFKGGNRSIGYVTPYRAQAELMELILGDLYKNELLEADIIAATVHRFQGSERDVMVFDSVDSYPQERPGMLLIGKDSDRLLNVAITRTRGKFIHVSDTHFTKDKIFYSKTYRKLVEHQLQEKQVIWPREIGSWIKNPHPRLRWMHAKKLEEVTKDIQSAKKSIIASLPKGNLVSPDWIQLLNDRAPGVELVIISQEVVHSIKANEYMEKSFPFPFILVDKRFLWLGMPLESAKGVLPPFVSARIDSHLLADYLLSQI
ncbi:AAA domain-containing protein [Bacillus sp. 31A1R]|uniref:AAA domain-containing protein n=1 Tax=Robertmurraya mangrovi TaxID=3098077 RepID=A0ABU5J370_9BACI|nr:AAA domain-containing protein [Bacillus sp. 31A1R]MDZ5473864.1 AAA domain-containing protein [Bacillus sp. 31A1R]